MAASTIAGHPGVAGGPVRVKASEAESMDPLQMPPQMVAERLVPVWTNVPTLKPSGGLSTPQGPFMSTWARAPEVDIRSASPTANRTLRRLMGVPPAQVYCGRRQRGKKNRVPERSPTRPRLANTGAVLRSRSTDASTERRSHGEAVAAQWAVRVQPATLPMTVALLTSCPAQSGASPVPSTLPESVPWVIEQPSTAL